MKYLTSLAVLGLLVFSFLPGTRADEEEKKGPQWRWSAENLAVIKSGKAERGAELADDNGCDGCHGENGRSEDGAFPNIAGQVPGYFVKQLYDYKNLQRRSDDMEGIVEEMSLQDMADLAAFFTKQKAVEKAPSEDIPHLADRGDKKRLLIACDACHGDKGVGRGFDVPRLAGQKQEYLESMMEAFKEGSRANDHYSRMRIIANRLKEKEVAALIKYYAQKEDDDDDE